MTRKSSFARFVCLPENRSAWLAVQDVAAGLAAGEAAGNPLFLFGPGGTGKSHLVSALSNQLADEGFDVLQVQAASVQPDSTAPDPVLLDKARSCDLLVVEDVQYVPARSIESLVQVMDERAAFRRPMAFSARTGPQRLSRNGSAFPNRLRSRLAAGLVVELEPLHSASRLVLLENLVRHQGLAVTREVLVWLAENLNGGCRELEGAVHQLEFLSQDRPTPLDVATVARHLRERFESRRPTVERIAQRVSGYFGVETRQLQSQRRHRNVLLPRQVGMYLSRRLTRLSLDEIGAYFGRRDHSTVLHACRKVEAALSRDGVLCGAVREIHAALV
jgi:chromosomal replication initiator protein